MKTIKKISIFAISMLIAAFAFGQNQKVEEVEVSAPQFTGIKNAAVIQNELPNTLIKKFLKENIVYPEDAAKCKIEGTEVVKFTVTTEGNAKDFRIINSVCPMIDEEVINALTLTDGMWMPGTKNGKPDDMTMELPFVFSTASNSVESIHEIFTEKATKYFVEGNQTLFEKKNVKKALKLYDKGVTYLPYDKGLLMARGICRFDLGDKEGAIEDWTRLYNLGGADMSEFVTLLKDMKGYNEMLAILKK